MQRLSDFTEVLLEHPGVSTTRDIMVISITWLWVLTAFVLLVLYPVASHAKPAPSDTLVLMWQVHRETPDSEMLFVKEKGVNLIQSFNLTRWADDGIKAYLDRAERFGMGVIVTIGGFIKQDAGKTKVFDFERARNFINNWKSHPAVFAWHPFDEAPNRRVPASFQEDVYKFIKGHDPSHPVFISWNGTSARHYKCCFSERAFDILDLHAYVRGTPGRRQQNLLKHFVSHRRGSYPIIITLRAFDGPRHPDLSPAGLRRQYDFFFRENHLTTNVGFYGWALSPNRGIRDVQDIMRQFKELEILQEFPGRN